MIRDTISEGFGTASSTTVAPTFMKPRLANYKIPKKVIVVDSLPHNASGKILKKELREKYSGIYTETNKGN